MVFLGMQGPAIKLHESLVVFSIFNILGRPRVFDDLEAPVLALSVAKASSQVLSAVCHRVHGICVFKLRRGLSAPWET